MVILQICEDFAMPDFSILLIDRCPGKENQMFYRKRSKPTHLDKENFMRKTKPHENIKRIVIFQISGDFAMRDSSILLNDRFPEQEYRFFYWGRSKPTHLDTKNFMRKTKPLENIKK